MKYQQFRWREGFPGIDYPTTAALIGGPPSALKEALSETASCLGLMEFDAFEDVYEVLGCGAQKTRPALGKRSSQAGRAQEEGGLKVTSDMAQHLVRIELPKCLLILTGEEYARAILREKIELRRQTNEKRTRGEGNILEAIDDGRIETFNTTGRGEGAKGRA